MARNAGHKVNRKIRHILLIYVTYSQFVVTAMSDTMRS